MQRDAALCGDLKSVGFGLVFTCICQDMPFASSAPLAMSKDMRPPSSIISLKEERMHRVLSHMRLEK